MTKFRERILLLFVLLVSLPTILFGQTDYRRAALWEKEIDAFAELDKRKFPVEIDALFVGSSSIRGWRSVAEDFAAFKVLNRGFGGAHLEDVIFYSGRIVFPYKPKLIVLYAGENDLVAGKSLERVFDDFKVFVKTVRRNLPRTRLLVVSVKPSPARWSYTPKFQELNRLMRAATEGDGHLQFVDVWSPMLDETGQPKSDIFLGDKLHMNPQGYKIWRAVLYPYVEAGIKGSFSRSKRGGE